MTRPVLPGLATSPPARGLGSGREILDAYWTPPALAHACVCVAAPLVRIHRGARLVEPAVGGGAFARALAASWPGVPVDRYDLDPDAPGLSDPRVPLGECVAGDWLRADPSRRWTMLATNPPYADVGGWLDACVARATYALLLLRGTVLGSVERYEWWRRHPPLATWTCVPRPAWEGPGARAQTDTSDPVLVLWGPGARQAHGWLRWR